MSAETFECGDQTLAVNTPRRPAGCYCRGNATCGDCEGHICAGQCTCENDGAPQQSLYGHANPTQDRLDAWKAKWEATR